MYNPVQNFIIAATYILLRHWSSLSFAIPTKNRCWIWNPLHGISSTLLENISSKNIDRKILRRNITRKQNAAEINNQTNRFSKILLSHQTTPTKPTFLQIQTDRQTERFFWRNAKWLTAWCENKRELFLCSHWKHSYIWSDRKESAVALISK